LYWYKCVRLSRLLAFECTLNHCTFISFHFIIMYGARERTSRVFYYLLNSMFARKTPRANVELYSAFASGVLRANV